ncbi:Suppressor of RPS4-RLD 1-like protein [Drosera capensis]
MAAAAAAAAVSDRAELARLCCSGNWSKAIRVLHSLISTSCTVQDLCNRAFCYSQLELHKHVIKDCDRALELDASLLRPYIVKGHAYSAPGRKEEALLVWKQGYDQVLLQSTDLKLLLELEELLRHAQQNGNFKDLDPFVESAGSSPPLTVSESHSGSESETSKDPNKSRVESEFSGDSEHESVVQSKFINGSNVGGGSPEKGEVNGKVTYLINGDKIECSNQSCGPERFSKFKDKSEPNLKITSSEPPSKPAHKSSNDFEWSDIMNKNKKFCVARISKTKSVHVDIRLSRGIAEVNDGRYAYAVTLFDKVIFHAHSCAGVFEDQEKKTHCCSSYLFFLRILLQILQEDSDYPEALIGRGTTYAFQRELDAAIADFTEAIELNPLAGEAWKRRGQARAALGDSASGLALSSIGDYKKAEESHLKALQLDRDSLEALTNLAQVFKELVALLVNNLTNLNPGYFSDDDFMVTLSLQLYQDLAKTDRAFECLDKILQINGSFAKGYYLRGLINHGMGDHREAVKDYNAALDVELDSMEKFVLQCLAFYEKEIALYTASKISSEFSWFDIDDDIHPLFKKLHRRLQGLGVLCADRKHSNKGVTKHGRKARRKGTVASQNRGGPGCSTSTSSEPTTSSGNFDDRSSSRSTMSWQDVYSVAVKWRQISEPCEPVVWINKLSEEFHSGFGSHTPLVLGQAKVVRYFPNFQRSLNVAKSVIKERKYVRSKTDAMINLSEGSKLDKIMHAESCSDLYNIIGEDFWLATWCNSTASEGTQLEGTRITVLKNGERGYDFSIRTACTPARWDEFDTEMTMAWEVVCNAYCGEAYGSTDFNALESVAEAILRMTYYWYNFMPPSRGSAVVGFIVLLGLCLAANMEFTGSILQGVQVDWEAILSFDPRSFVELVKEWLYPHLKVTASWKDYPDVPSTFSTTGSVIAALSSYDKWQRSGSCRNCFISALSRVAALSEYVQSQACFPIEADVVGFS